MSKPRPSPARLKALVDARQRAKQAAITAHLTLVSEIAAGATARTRARSNLFDGFFEALAEDAGGMLEERMADIDDAYRRDCGYPPPAMKS